VLRTPLGQMRGSYTMTRDDGRTFEADIAPFALAVPAAMN
jgi:ApaG protein